MVRDGCGPDFSRCYRATGELTKQSQVGARRLPSARCTSGGGGIVLGDVDNTAEKNEIDDNAEGILVFATKRTGGVRLYGNTLRRNGVGINVQAGVVGTDVKDNTLDANGIGLLDFGAATTLVGNGPQH